MRKKRDTAALLATLIIAIALLSVAFLYVNVPPPVPSTSTDTSISTTIHGSTSASSSSSGQVIVVGNGKVNETITLKGNTSNVKIGAFQPVWDEQFGLTLTSNSASLKYNVTAVAQNSTYGPAYLLNGLTNARYWYQVGIGYNWVPGTGFMLAYEVFDPNSRSVYPTTGGGGLASFSGQVNPNDLVGLSLYFLSGNVVMSAFDYNTSATGTVSYSSEGATQFLGNSSSFSNSKGYFTGLMTEWLHNTPYYGNESKVQYSSCLLAQASAWMWSDEFSLSNGTLLFPPNFVKVTYLTPTQIHWVYSNGVIETSDSQDFATGGSPTNTTITSYTKQMVEGRKAFVAGGVIDAFNNTKVSGLRVYAYLSNQSEGPCPTGILLGESLVNSNGLYNITFTVPNANVGNYQIYTYTSGQGTQFVSSWNDPPTQLQAATQINLRVPAVFPSSITGTLLKEPGGAGIPNEIINLTITGLGYKDSANLNADLSGVITFPWQPPASGGFTITLTFNGTSFYLASSNSTTITVYSVSFTESGLPSNTQWTVTLAGDAQPSKVSSVPFYAVNGNYAYTISTPIYASTFVRYVTSGSGSIGISSSQNIPVPYVAQYFLSMTINPAGAGSLSVQSGWFNNGSTIPINASANAGYQFLRWIGSGKGNYTGFVNASSITMNGQINETANFLVGLNLGYTFYGGGSPGSFPRLTYDNGTSQTVTLTTFTKTYYADPNTMWNVSSNLGSTGFERWATNQAPANATRFLTLNLIYYHQFYVALNYSTFGGGNGFSSPLITYVEYGSNRTVIANSSVWIDSSSITIYPLTLSGSTSNERWALVGPLSVAVDSNNPITEIYYHQYSLQVTTILQVNASSSFAAVQKSISSSQSSWYNSSSTFAAIAGSRIGYSFNGWFGSGVGNYTGASSTAMIDMLGPINESVLYTQLVYPVAFSEAGLPNGTNWAVVLNGTTKSSGSNTITFECPLGVYNFSVKSVSGYTSSPASGVFDVNGQGVYNQVITWQQISYLWLIIALVVASAIIAASFAFWRSKRNGSKTGPGVGAKATFLTKGKGKVSIQFPQIASAFPLVWGLGDPLTVKIAIEDASVKLESPLSLKLLVDNSEEDIEMPLSGEAANKYTINQKGKHTFRILSLGQEQEILSEAQITIVDYKEEIVRLFNEYFKALGQKSPHIKGHLTPREVQSLLSGGLPEKKRKPLDDFITVFELANYSERSMKREEYERMYLSLLQLGAE